MHMRAVRTVLIALTLLVSLLSGVALAMTAYLISMIRW